MRRSPNTVFVGGHYVFPGGAVDADDHVVAATPTLLTRAEHGIPRTGGNAPGSVDSPELGSNPHDLKPVDDGPLDVRPVEGGRVEGGRVDGTNEDTNGSDDGLEHAAYVVAAVREAFEEAGLFLARLPTGGWVDFTDDRIRAKFGEYRSGLNAGTVSFADVLRREHLHIRASDLTYWSRWITPIGPPRRFDARFFIAEMPFSHEASPDHGELVHSEWVRPAEALRRFEEGEFPIIFPTIKTLQSMRDGE